MALSQAHWIDCNSIGPMVFAGAALTYPYKDGKKDSVSDGIRIDVLLMNHAMERLSVRIPGASVLPEFKPLTPVDFTDLKVSAYVGADKWLKFRATAREIKAIDRNRG